MSNWVLKLEYGFSEEMVCVPGQKQKGRQSLFDGITVFLTHFPLRVMVNGQQYYSLAHWLPPESVKFVQVWRDVSLASVSARQECDQSPHCQDLSIEERCDFQSCKQNGSSPPFPKMWLLKFLKTWQGLVPALGEKMWSSPRGFWEYCGKDQRI